MGTHYMRNDDGQVVGIITMANIYRFKGFIFEVHYYGGPVKLKKDFSPAAREGRKFWQVFAEWEKLTDAEKAETQIAG
jgi:hypothetical protein